VQYGTPAPRPPDADALLSDQGIMNAAVGYRDRAQLVRAHAAATALGASATTAVPAASGSVYLRLAEGLSFEQLLVPPGLDAAYGFAAQPRPSGGAPAHDQAHTR
jgi:hypothetical protein